MDDRKIMADLLRSEGEPLPLPEIQLTTWGCGNYYLEDLRTGKSVRISPNTYWAIIEKVHNYMKDLELNGVEVRG